ncbi:MAG: hypothetical protein EOP94_01125 [Zymomonas sp.]|nr:MAG: hypothetical protein EOP94_01125 [Zymomonas sp.]
MPANIAITVSGFLMCPIFSIIRGPSQPLNPGQLAAATMILASPERTVTVQGVAGAGKATMLGAVARVAEAEGRGVLGLAFQNKMVGDLAEGAGIRAQTLASFLAANERFVSDRDSTGFAKARAALVGSLVVVDEASMVPSRQMLALHRLVETLEIDKLVLVGDRQQLSSIEAGKAFAMIQAGGGALARMDVNLRQRTSELRVVAALANRGLASEAMRVLGERVIENAKPALPAADMWLGLSPVDREKTMIFASGRENRGIVNERAQEGLRAKGTLAGSGMALVIHDRVSATREELRYPGTYRAGQLLEVPRGGAADIGLARGSYRVRGVTRGGLVEVRGKAGVVKFDPQQLSPTDQRDRLQLSESRPLRIYEGDQIRWTANDKDRGLLNSAPARVLTVERGGVTVELADKTSLRLERGDPMLARLDLAYALNMHMAQGITTDRAITVMSSSERQLSNQRLFNVGVTRVRDGLTLFVDDRAKLERQLDHSPGNKTSALETVGMLGIDKGRGRMSEAGRENSRGDLSPALLPLPERSLSLDL